MGADNQAERVIERIEAREAKDIVQFENLIEEQIRTGLTGEAVDETRLRLIEAGIKLLAVRTRKKEPPIDEGAFFNGKGLADES